MLAPAPWERGVATSLLLASPSTLHGCQGSLVGQRSSEPCASGSPGRRLAAPRDFVPRWSPSVSEAELWPAPVLIHCTRASRACDSPVSGAGRGRPSPSLAPHTRAGGRTDRELGASCRARAGRCGFSANGGTSGEKPRSSGGNAGQTHGDVLLPVPWPWTKDEQERTSAGLALGARRTTKPRRAAAGRADGTWAGPGRGRASASQPQPRLNPPPRHDLLSVPCSSGKKPSSRGSCSQRSTPFPGGGETSRVLERVSCSPEGRG